MQLGLKLTPISAVVLNFKVGKSRSNKELLDIDFYRDLEWKAFPL